MKKITGNKLKYTKVKNTSIYDIPYFITDNTLANKIYKWQPKKNIIDIVRDNYKWLIENKKNLIKIDK